MFSAISVLVIAAIAAGWKIMKAFADKTRRVRTIRMYDSAQPYAAEEELCK